MDNNKSEFDKIAKEYSDNRIKDLGKLGKYSDTAFIYKVQLMKHILKKEPKTILDFGCGIGSNIPYLHSYFKNAKLYGCDVSVESIEIAKNKYEYCDFKTVDNINDLQCYKNIDCIFISTVLHHIPREEHKTWLDGLYNILTDVSNSDGGTIIIFEHNMKNPITRSIVKKSKIDENAVMLNSIYCKRLLLNIFYQTKIKNKEISLKKNNVKLKFTYFFPWRNKIFNFIENIIYWLPLGAQYCVYAQKRNKL